MRKFRCVRRYSLSCEVLFISNTLLGRCLKPEFDFKLRWMSRRSLGERRSTTGGQNSRIFRLILAWHRTIIVGAVSKAKIKDWHRKGPSRKQRRKPRPTATVHLVEGIGAHLHPGFLRIVSGKDNVHNAGHEQRFTPNNQRLLCPRYSSTTSYWKPS